MKLNYDTSYDSKINFLEIDTSECIAIIGTRNKKISYLYRIDPTFTMIVEKSVSKREPLDNLIKESIKNNIIELILY
jgi:hypothetical protein